MILVNVNTTMLWQVINFLVLLWLLKRYLYGPITEMLKKRAARIEGDLNAAAEERKEAEKLKEEYEAQLKTARSKSQDIVEDAETRAKKKAREIIKEAEKKAENIKKNKMAEIEQAKKEALAQLRNEVASISLLAASKLIQEKMDQEKHKQLIKSYIAKLDKNKLGELQ
ncbi:F0F1 ATP synthase subunit B [Iocasia frigidifontis]|uniref:F0F1 ATP synthase subunit B n=1 Tax=Iocasia fonsfrigidae TaxID=2682810 RepID=UPI001E5064B7|nr:F0F1 ATP synthase subunit B [Iocasia fonsfrigidae]